MSRRPRPTACALGLALLLATAVAPARADMQATVTVSITPESGGMFLYDYTVADLATSTSAVSEFDLSLTLSPFSGINTPPGAPISSITMQPGFINLYSTGDPSISFFSTDPSTDIAPGTSGSFSFTSTYAPVYVPYMLSTFDGTGSSVSGSIFAPATVPEPSTLALAAAAALGLAGWRLLGRRRARASASV